MLPIPFFPCVTTPIPVGDAANYTAAVVLVAGVLWILARNRKPYR